MGGRATIPLSIEELLKMGVLIITCHFRFCNEKSGIGEIDFGFFVFCVF